MSTTDVRVQVPPRAPKKYDHPKGGRIFLVRRFCCAKVVACGRLIEREWGNPQRFPPHTPPSLRWAGVRATKPVGNHKNKTPSEGMGFCFWNAAGRLELTASTCAKRVKFRGEAGFLRMAVVLTSSISLRFVCCKTFVHFAARPLPTETAPLGFGGDPSFVGCREAGSSLVARSGSETSCLTRIPACGEAS